MHWPKIIHTRVMLMKKIIWHENSPSPLPLPINFSNVRPLQEN